MGWGGVGWGQRKSEASIANCYTPTPHPPHTAIGRLCLKAAKGSQESSKEATTDPEARRAQERPPPTLDFLEFDTLKKRLLQDTSVAPCGLFWCQQRRPSAGLSWPPRPRPQASDLLPSQAPDPAPGLHEARPRPSPRPGPRSQILFAIRQAKQARERQPDRRYYC